MIEGEVYEIPKRFTIQQWCAAIKWDFTRPGQWPHIVNAITGAPINTLKEVAYESMELAIVFIGAVMQERKEVNLKDFNDMTFGEWVDLDVYTALGIDKNLDKMLNLLHPDIKWSDEGLWVLDKYIEFKTHILRQYKELFGINDGNEDYEDTEPAPVDGMHVARSWYKVIVNLASDNILNLDAVTDQPLKKVLNFMALQKEKAIEERNKAQQQRIQNDLHRTRK